MQITKNVQTRMIERRKKKVEISDETTEKKPSL